MVALIDAVLKTANATGFLHPHRRNDRIFKGSLKCFPYVRLFATRPHVLLIDWLILRTKNKVLCFLTPLIIFPIICLFFYTARISKETDNNFNNKGVEKERNGL